jgi:hypothetical protein
MHLLVNCNFLCFCIGFYEDTILASKIRLRDKHIIKNLLSFYHGFSLKYIMSYLPSKTPLSNWKYKAKHTKHQFINKVRCSIILGIWEYPYTIIPLATILFYLVLSPPLEWKLWKRIF